MRERLGHQLNLTARVFVKKLNEQIAAQGLYSSQWPVVVRLFEHGEATQIELCDFLAVEPPTMTRTLTRMEAAGWIIRKQGKDRRERRVDLSPQAMEKFGAWYEMAMGLEEQALLNVTQQDLAAFHRVLVQIRSNLNFKESGE